MRRPESFSSIATILVFRDPQARLVVFGRWKVVQKVLFFLRVDFDLVLGEDFPLVLIDPAPNQFLVVL